MVVINQIHIVDTVQSVCFATVTLAHVHKLTVFVADRLETILFEDITDKSVRFPPYFSRYSIL